MKKIFLATIVAIAGWLSSHAQALPAPEKYNDYIEQVSAMADAEQKKAEFLMGATMEALSKDPAAYRQMLELAERRFSNAADAIHNEGLYMSVLQHAVDNYVLSAGEKERQRLLLEGARKNMIGTVAADFDYVTPKDKTARHLKELKADYILVYFNNPDCESCETVKERLASNELINNMVKEKKLIVLAIYPYDDKNLWKKANYPSMMINGWNQSRQIEYAELYDLPTLPCFYLLDGNFTVLAKNEGSLNKIEAQLKKLTSPVVEEPAPAQATAPQTQKAAKQPVTPPHPTIMPAPADDPNTARSEEVLGFIVENKCQEMYDSMSDLVKDKVQPSTFDGSFAQLESRFGKYQGHEAWEIQSLPNIKAYTSVLNFEKSKLRFIITYDEQGKVRGVNMTPVAPGAPKQN